jgi:hypothetical protein
MFRRDPIPTQTFATIAPAHHMINRSFLLDAQLPGHACIFIRAAIAMSILRTDPYFPSSLTSLQRLKKVAELFLVTFSLGILG